MYRGLGKTIPSLARVVIACPGAGVGFTGLGGMEDAAGSGDDGSPLQSLPTTGVAVLAVLAASAGDRDSTGGCPPSASRN